MKTQIIVLLSLFAAISSVRAIPLVTYSFTGSSGSEVSLAPDAQPANASASSMTRGSGLTTSAAVDTFSSSSWTTFASIDVNDYYAFSLTPDAGSSLTLTQLVLDERRSGTGIRNWSVRSSLDSYGADIATFAVPDNDLTRTGQAINLSALFANLTSVLDFRIYGYGAEGSAGTWRIDNVKVEGSTQLLPAVPDTGTTAVLLSIPLLGLFTLRRLTIRPV